MNIHTKTAIESIKRSPFQAISAIFVLSLTFFVATTVAVLVYASNKTISYFETRPQVIVFLKDDAKTETLANLENKLRSNVNIKDIKFVPKEEALEIYKKATEDNPLLSDLVSPSIFPASFEFSVVNLDLTESIINNIKDDPAIKQIGFTANFGGEKSISDVLSKLKTVSKYVRLGGIAFVGVLAITSIIVLLVIISMRMVSRKGEIEILSLIGATPAFLRGPVIIEAMIYVVTGVLTGFMLSFVMWLYLSPSIINYFNQISILPRDPLSFFLLFVLILGIEFVVGILIALVGSLLAVNRSLKKAK